MPPTCLFLLNDSVTELAKKERRRRGSAIFQGVFLNLNFYLFLFLIRGAKFYLAFIEGLVLNVCVFFSFKFFNYNVPGGSRAGGFSSWRRT